MRTARRRPRRFPAPPTRSTARSNRAPLPDRTRRRVLRRPQPPDRRACRAATAARRRPEPPRAAPVSSTKLAPPPETEKPPSAPCCRASQVADFAIAPELAARPPARNAMIPNAVQFARPSNEPSARRRRSNSDTMFRPARDDIEPGATHREHGALQLSRLVQLASAGAHEVDRCPSSFFHVQRMAPGGLEAQHRPPRYERPDPWPCRQPPRFCARSR